jgi:hypothetical protein
MSRTLALAQECLKQAICIVRLRTLQSCCFAHVFAASIFDITIVAERAENFLIDAASSPKFIPRIFINREGQVTCREASSRERGFFCFVRIRLHWLRHAIYREGLVSVKRLSSSISSGTSARIRVTSFPFRTTNPPGVGNLLAIIRASSGSPKNPTIRAFWFHS